MSPKTDARKSAKSATLAGKPVKGFTEEERAAMKERVHELKAEARRGPRAKKADGENEGTVWPVAFALKELTAADAARIGALVKKTVS